MNVLKITSFKGLVVMMRLISLAAIIATGACAFAAIQANLFSDTPGSIRLMGLELTNRAQREFLNAQTQSELAAFSEAVESEVRQDFLATSGLIELCIDDYIDGDGGYPLGGTSCSPTTTVVFKPTCKLTRNPRDENDEMPICQVEFAWVPGPAGLERPRDGSRNADSCFAGFFVDGDGETQLSKSILCMAPTD